MENFQPSIPTVMKTEKKDMLLSSKDPHLSHLFEHGGPSTPNNMSTDNIAPSNMDVDGNYQEESNEQEYSLFQEQGASFIPAFNPDSSHLVMDVSCADASARRCMPSDENNNSCGEKPKMVVSGNHQQIRGMKKAGIQQPLRPPNLLIAPANVQGEPREGDKPQILSPPADHYNMQLLAHSAHHQQQLLQQQRQQAQQEEIFTSGSSSAALQRFAKLHQQKAQNVEMMEDQSSFAAKPAGFPVYVQGDNVKVDSAGKPVPLPIAANQAGSVPLPFSSSMQPPSKHPPSLISNYQNWQMGGERATPDFEKSHVRDLSFGSQDSPVFTLQMADIVKNSGASKNLLPTSLYSKQNPNVLPVSSNEPGPELKSPLDHPDQLERHRSRFFSTDSGPASGGEQPPPDDDEAPLNEHDKKAAAAISKLMEQSEKNPPVSHPRGSSVKINNIPVQDHNFVRPNNPNSALPLNILQVQELFRNTPPPTYEQSLLPSGLPSGLAPVQASAALAMANTDVKREPDSPAKPVRQHYISGDEHYQNIQQNCPQVQLPDGQSKFQPGGNVDMTSRNCVVEVGNPPLTAGLSESNPYAPMQQSASIITTEKTVSTLQSKPTPASRARRTSSSGSNRRKSDGNLTCGLCGNSFRSTPALNGHMRVHSTPEKKQNKEERQARSSNDSAPKSSPLIKPSISPQSQQYYDSGKMPLVPVQADASGGNTDGNVRLIPYQYPTEALDPSLQNRSHNGLLTMASAACFLKTEASKAEYPNTVLPSAYIVPHPVLFQQPTVVPSSYPVDVLNSNLTENQSAPNPFQQGLPFSNISFFANMPQVPPPPLIQQDAAYPPNNQPQIQMMPAAERDENLNINSQNYANQPEKPMIMVGGPDESFPGQFAPAPNQGTNSLSQLASIAVAAANREYDPNSNMQPEMAANYPANDLQQTNTEPGSADNIALMQSNMGPGPQQNCLGQEEVFQGSNIAAETSPLQSGHDPFIFPVSGPNPNQQRNHYGNYNSVSNNVPGNREPMVTWKDNVDTRSYSLLSYDDPLMQEAVNVANPSKILPNSMMGGTPPAGSILSGARPFRQRHHSEGAHLIKNSENSLLKRILDSPVSADMPASSERLGENERQDAINVQVPPDGMQTTDMYAVNNTDKNLQVPSDSTETKKVEIWAEPKSIPRRVRRRRHSADSRLFLKPGSFPNRLVQHVGNPAKKVTGLRKNRDRRRPPPLVIPSSVNTFSSGSHQNLYTSHLHHRRRPSGESSASAAGLNDKIPPYTPPPMLSPIRAGSGLFCTTPVTPMMLFHRQKSIEAGIPTIVEEDESAEEDDEELVRSSEPKINIGSRFQATIPIMRPRESLKTCKHRADKVWSPKKIVKDENVFKHVERFMELSCSAVVPFGGANKEFALDCIAQNNGDILNAVRRLITRKNDGVVTNKKMKNYTGSGQPWTSQEAKAFECAMLENRKDFFVISRMVKTRTTAECVERYYHVVKRNRRRSRLPRRYRDHENDEFATLLADSLNEKKISQSSASASSSEDEMSKHKQTSSDSDLSSWLPPEHASKPELSQPSFYSHASPNLQSHPQPAYPKPVKTHTARIQHGRLESPSPVGSPASNMSSDDQPSQVFTCPVCGKSFAKVKSRNAHMKTHGKQAQEKRRQREEEAARRKEELANRQHAHQRPMPAPMHPANFIHPSSATAGKLYPHPPHHSLSQPHPDLVMPRYSASM